MPSSLNSHCAMCGNCSTSGSGSRSTPPGSRPGESRWALIRPRSARLWWSPSSALADGDAGLIAESNAELHETIVALADNSLLTAMMRSVFGRDRWIFRMTSDRDPWWHAPSTASCAMPSSPATPEFTAATAYAHIERGRAPTLETLKAVLPP